MKTFSPDTFSYGVELEYGNCWRGVTLTDGAQWNFLDNTCVSSTGIANDPQGKLYAYGGEINTRPTNTIKEQVDHIQLINKTLADGGPAPIVNYRSNLHIHVRVPGLSDDLDALKRLLRYVTAYQQQAFDITETIPVPDPKFMKPEVYKWAKKRMNRRKTSHQQTLPQKRVEAMLAATTPLEFYHEHAHKDAKGNPAWFQCPRAGINMRQLFETTNTIEFRHFPGTLDAKEMESAITWCHYFVDAALNHEDKTPQDILADYNFKFGDFQPYEYETEQVYQATNFDKNSRKDVEKLLTKIRESVKIDDMATSSVEVHNKVLELIDEGFIRMSW